MHFGLFTFFSLVENYFCVSENSRKYDSAKYKYINYVFYYKKGLISGNLLIFARNLQIIFLL